MKVSRIFKISLVIVVFAVGIWFLVTDIQFQQMKNDAQRTSTLKPGTGVI